MLLLLAVGSSLPGVELSQVKSEPNLEKRSRLALEHADATLKEARNVYEKGEAGKTNKLIAEVRESVELAEQSLKETGKNPRKSPKYFKKAEIDTRALLKRIEGFQDEMNVNDRPSLDPLRSKVQQVHDDLLMGIMEGKHK